MIPKKAKRQKIKYSDDKKIKQARRNVATAYSCSTTRVTHVHKIGTKLFTCLISKAQLALHRSLFNYTLSVFLSLIKEPCHKSVLGLLLTGINSFATTTSRKLSSRIFISSLLKLFLLGIGLVFSLKTL